MDSEEATFSPPAVSSAPGSSPINNSSSNHTETENVSKINVEITDSDINSNNNSEGKSVSDVTIVGGQQRLPIPADPDEGTLEKTIGEEKLNDSVVGSADVSMLKSEKPVSEISMSEGVENVEVLGGGKGEDVGGSVPVIGNSLPDSTDSDATKSMGTGIEGSEGNTEEFDSADKLNSIEQVKDSGGEVAVGAELKEGEDRSTQGEVKETVEDEKIELKEGGDRSIEEELKETVEDEKMELQGGEDRSIQEEVKEIVEDEKNEALASVASSNLKEAEEPTLVIEESAISSSNLKEAEEPTSVIEESAIASSNLKEAEEPTLVIEESAIASSNLKEVEEHTSIIEESTIASSNLKEAEEPTSVIEERAIHSDDAEKLNKVVVEQPSESLLAETDGEKFTSEGDAVVDAIEVNVSGPAVAVVGDVEESKEVEEHIEGTTDENVTSVNDVGETRQPIEEVANMTVDEVDAQDPKPVVDDTVAAAESKPVDNIVGAGKLDSGDVQTSDVVPVTEEIKEADPETVNKRLDSKDVEADTDEEGDGKELFDSAALAALLKAATGGDSDGGNITITSQDGSRLFSVERPAGLGSSLRSLRPAPRPSQPNLFTHSSLQNSGESENNLSEEEKKKLETLQQIRVKFLRLIHRLGLSSDEPIAAQVLYRMTLIARRQNSPLFSIEAAKMKAFQLEAEGKDDLDFSVNILVIGKSGVGKSATINSIFGEEKTSIDAFGPATTSVKEISGVVDGVKIRVFDTPGLKSSAMEQGFNRSVLSSVKKLTKKNTPDIFLYVDRLDAQTRDLNDLPMLKTITSCLGPSIWRSAIVTLTHGASAPPDGPSGSPLSYEVFVTQRSHVVQQSIGQAVGDLRMMSPSLMNPVSLVENHPSCRRNRDGHKILPNGQSWRPQLLLLSYSMKILSEASALSKPEDPFDHRKLFGFRTRSPPLPYMLSSMLQSRAHPKLSAEQGGDNGDSDIDLDDLSDSDQEEEDEYDQLPPFKPLRKAQLAKLSKEQRKAYFEEYDYRVKLLQKKQLREELKRMKEMKGKGKEAAIDYGYAEEEADAGAAAPVAVPLPDMALPPSFDSDNPAYRYRFLEPTSQFLARPVLDTHGWDHDCGYDGVNVEQSLAIASRFPAAVTVQITKDKKDFSINLDSSIAAKHGENVSTMAGFDIQSIGKQLAYIVRGETKFKNLKKNKTACGISVTFLGENMVTGLKVEDQIILGKQYVLVGSAGTVRSQSDTAYGANFELQRREADFPIGQVQSTLSMSVIKWRGDLALGFNSMAQFAVGRNSKVAVRAGINNKLSGQVTVRTSSSDHLSLALTAIIPTAIGIYRKLWPDVGENYSIY
ncbi:hypothetical protein H5410_048121 [Solanum commersonii]|uniref:AIG1-type G domain-containing protein n=1 Tax=Solanum commersonii TaxID=4109 RepID=A0A9J5XJF5_SOLCO|nr:hypothetical protein H5410_048121 [Solanum commersonii]